MSARIEPANLRILKYPHPALRKRATAVTQITDEVRAVAARMIELMREAKGVGLAATQVGLAWRMFVANAGGENEVDRVYVNPVLRDAEGDPEGAEEGCLSIPEVVGDVWRPPVITIDATDLEGRAFSLRGEGLIARAWQHEFDHLEGRLILDRFGQMDKLANRRMVRELERGAKTDRWIGSARSAPPL